MRRTTLTAVAITAATVTLASCSSTAKPARALPAVATASPTASSPTATPTPSATARAPLAVGATWEWETSNPTTKVSGSTTVESYQQDVAHDAPRPEKAFGSESHGYVWASLKVKICSDATSAKTVPVGNSSWRLTYADGTIIEPSDTGFEQFPQPKFPFGDTDMAPGRCVAGAIVFPVPGDKRPARAMYAPEGLADPTEWNLPAG